MAPSLKGVRRSWILVPALVAAVAGALPASAARAQRAGGAPGLAAGTGGEERRLRPRWRPEKDLEQALAPWRDPTRLVLKLADGARARVLDGTLEASAGGTDIIAVQALLEGFPELRISPYVDVETSALDEMRAVGEERLGAELADLSQYFLVELDEGADVRWLVERLLALPEVEEAYGMPRAITVAGDITPPTTPSLWGWQPQIGNYGFPSVASWPGGNGAGVTITDVEGAWNLKGMFGDTITHEDLQGLDLQSPPPAAWDPSTWVIAPGTDSHHGTAVLGILGADVDSTGMNGLVPGATLRVSGAHTTAGWRIADAIVKAARAMGPGGIILLELQINGPNVYYTPQFGATCCQPPYNHPTNCQFGYLPIEFLDAEFNAIRQATALGINVIEPAGNGEQDLDDWNDGPVCSATGSSVYGIKFDPNLRNSGAIVVGATGSNSFGGQRAWFSNHGRRVDACAQGENLGTLGYGSFYDGGGDIDQFYTATFGGTSGASPQVAAAAAILQAAKDSYHGSFEYAPHALRLFLRSSGLPTSIPAIDRIGEQPWLVDQYRLQATGPHAALVFDRMTVVNAQLGKWVEGLGDVDGDGYGDVAVSEPGYNASYGHVYVLSGATGEIWWQFDWGTGGAQGPRICGGGDFDGNGYADFILSDPTTVLPGPVGGFAAVYDGWTRSLLQWTGGALDEQWGCSTDFIDLDGNGTDELVIGAKGWNGGRGRIYLYRNVLLGSIDGEAAWPGLGHDVANVGDVNRDGTPDFAASATSVDVVAGGPGKVYVFSGADRSVIWSWTDAGNNGFGAALAGGDANADGYADVVVGMPFYSGIDAQRGRVIVYSGRTGSVLHTLDGHDAGGRFGWNVDGMGDVDGSGSAGFLVSAYDEREPGPSQQVGAVHVFDGASASLLRTYWSEDSPGFNWDDFGFAAANAGDIDGDGRNDVIVGAPGWKDFSFHGRAYTYLSPRPLPEKHRRADGFDGDEVRAP